MSVHGDEPDTVPGSLEYMRVKRAELLRFAAGARCEAGFAWLDNAGVADTTRPIELWITARATYVFALGVLADEPPAMGARISSLSVASQITAFARCPKGRCATSSSEVGTARWGLVARRVISSRPMVTLL
ncbi:MAG: hypothetical protein ACTHWA_12980 [Arachnia sp.]